MSNKFGPSIYYVTDKNIYDALHSRKFSSKVLASFLKEKGILVKPDTTREQLIAYVATIQFDYFDYLFVCSLLEKAERREKTTSKSIKTAVTDTEITEVSKNITKSLNEDSEQVKTFRRGESTVIQVHYTEVDFGKSELSQRTNKICEIELQKNETNLVIRGPANEKANAVSSLIVSELGKVKNQNELEEFTISLMAFADPSSRSYFFQQLMRNVSGYKLYDVSSVTVHRGIDDGESDEEKESELSRQFAGHIHKAALTGEGVLESAEFNQLHDSNFFISRAVWTAIEDLPKGHKVEFEALFGNPATCTDYKYALKGIYNYRDAEHTINHRKPSKEELRKLTLLLEEASNKSYLEVSQKFGEAETNEED